MKFWPYLHSTITQTSPSSSFSDVFGHLEVLNELSKEIIYRLKFNWEYLGTENNRKLDTFSSVKSIISQYTFQFVVSLIEISTQVVCDISLASNLWSTSYMGGLENSLPTSIIERTEYVLSSWENCLTKLENPNLVGFLFEATVNTIAFTEQYDSYFTQPLIKEEAQNFLHEVTRFLIKKGPILSILQTFSFSNIPHKLLLIRNQIFPSFSTGVAAELAFLFFQLMLSNTIPTIKKNSEWVEIALGQYLNLMKGKIRVHKNEEFWNSLNEYINENFNNLKGLTLPSNLVKELSTYIPNIKI